MLSNQNPPATPHTDDALSNQIGVAGALAYKSSTKNIFFTSITSTNVSLFPQAPDTYTTGSAGQNNHSLDFGFKSSTVACPTPNCGGGVSVQKL